MAETDGLEIARVVATLRKELEQAIDEGRGKPLTFTLESAELELKVGVTQSGEGKAGVKLWVLDAQATTQVANQLVQTIKLTLRPQRVDGATGLTGNVQIAEVVEKRPR